MRLRLRRLVAMWRKPAPAGRPAEASPVQDDGGRLEAERRLEDAQRRLKRAVPPRED